MRGRLILLVFWCLDGSLGLFERRAEKGGRLFFKFNTFFLLDFSGRLLGLDILVVDTGGFFFVECHLISVGCFIVVFVLKFFWFYLGKFGWLVG